MSSGSGRVPELDGIRGAAILLVLIWHYIVGAMPDPSSPIAQGIRWVGMQTWSGVDLFFVLSGFLIGGILIDAKDSDNYFRTFYIRRAFRILPIYVAICSAYAILHGVAREPVEHLFGQPMPWFIYATFTQNFWLAHHPWNSFLDVSWSLAVEEQFYLTLPAIIWFTPRRHLWKVIAGLALAGAATRAILYLHFYPDWRSAAYTLTTSRADALLFGVLATIAVRSHDARAFLCRRTNVLRVSAVLAAAIIAVITFKGWGMNSTAMSTIGYTVMAALYSSVLLMAVTSPGSLVSRIFRFRWLRWLGGIAYCLYLVHLHMQQLVYMALGYSVPLLQRARDLIPLLLALTGSLVISHLSWIWLESRLVRFGHRFIYRSSPPLVSETSPASALVTARGASVSP